MNKAEPSTRSKPAELATRLFQVDTSKASHAYRVSAVLQY
jgi:hypothetical protein